MLRLCPSIEKSDTIRHVVIQREDLEKIIESFKSRDLPVTICDYSSKYTDIDDYIQKHGSHAADVEIYSWSEKHGSFSIKFKNDGACLYAAGSEVIRGLFQELTDLMIKRRNWIKHFCMLKIWPIISFSALTAEFILVFIKPIRSEISLLWHIFLCAIIVVWPLFCVYLHYLPTVMLEACNDMKLESVK